MLTSRSTLCPTSLQYDTRTVCPELKLHLAQPPLLVKLVLSFHAYVSGAAPSFDLSVMVRLAQSIALTTPRSEWVRGGIAHKFDVAASIKPAATVIRMKFGFINGLHASLARLHQLAGTTLGCACGRSSRERGMLLPITGAGPYRCVLLDERRDRELRMTLPLPTYQQHIKKNKTEETINMF